MASNGNPQFVRQVVRQVFSHQPNGAVAETHDAAVGQDKARIASARTASAQPAAVKKITRADKLNRKTPRSQNKPTPNKRTKKLTLWVEPIVKEELQRIATREGLSLSQSGAAFLKRSLQQHIDLAYSALLEPIIRHEIHHQMQGISNRLAWLLARNAFAVEQTRAITTNILGRQTGMTEEMLKHILAMTKQTAQGNLTQRHPELAELLAAIKQWADEAEKEPRTQTTEQS